MMLHRAASFWVKLIDAGTGAPIPRGEVTVALPSGALKGPFPTNMVGLRVATFVPGPARFGARAEGYLELRGVEIDLPAGVETLIELKLDPVPAQAD